jgi:hypothetical protein
MLNRTVEFIVTTVGGICSGSTMSARSSSARSSSFPGKAWAGSDSSKVSSRSRSWDVSTTRGLRFISTSFKFQACHANNSTAKRFGWGSPGIHPGPPIFAVRCTRKLKGAMATRNAAWQEGRIVFYIKCHTSAMPGDPRPLGWEIGPHRRLAAFRPADQNCTPSEWIAQGPARPA